MSCEFCGDGPTCCVCGKGLAPADMKKTLLDEAAIAAMQGIIAGRSHELGVKYSHDLVCREAYKYARAMMQEREAHINKKAISASTNRDADADFVQHARELVAFENSAYYSSYGKDDRPYTLADFLAKGHKMVEVLYQAMLVRQESARPSE